MNDVLGCMSFSPFAIAAMLVWFALPAIALGALTSVLFRPGRRARSVDFVAGATAALGGLNVMAGVPFWPLLVIGFAEISLALAILFFNRR